MINTITTAAIAAETATTVISLNTWSSVLPKLIDKKEIYICAMYFI